MVSISSGVWTHDKKFKELKKALDHQVDQEKLNRYLKHSREAKWKETKAPNNNDNIEKVCRGYHMRLRLMGLTRRARKAHLQEIKHQVLNIGSTTVKCHAMTFGSLTGKYILPHDNSGVKGTSLIVAHHLIYIITLDYFQKLKYTYKDVIATSQRLIGLEGGSIYHIEFIKLPVRLSERGKGISIPVNFVVVDTPLSYNIIMGQTNINKNQSRTLVYQLLI